MQEKIVFELAQNDWHGYPSETLWSEHLPDGTFKILNVPFYVKGISLYDIVVAELRVDGYYMKFIKERSGHSTYRLILLSHVTAEAFRNQWIALEEIGCTYEKGKGSLFAIDVPPSVDIYKAYELLQEGERNEIWEFEEGHCGHSIKEA